MSLRNVTITLDEETARWARIEAARQDTSVSKMIGNLLRTSMLEQQTYEAARISYQGRSPSRLKRRHAAYPRREELHNRADLR